MDKYALHPNPLVRFLKKEPRDFTQEDLIRYISEEGIRMVNFRYAAADGRLKALNFIINDLDYLRTILTYGERVDGSSLFPYIQAGSSDLYVVPRYRTAFRNPFSEIPTLDILCGYYDKEGNPLASAPDQALRRAHAAFKELTGMEFHAMGELEYYVVSEAEELYVTPNQRGYHESGPFCKWGEMRREAMKAIAEAGGKIKYGHSEVGNFVVDGMMYEQNEIEFLPVDVEEAADQLLIAKWILREIAYQYGVQLTFAPKITEGKAGSGLHVHTKVVKEGENMYLRDGKLTDVAKTVIAGILDAAPSLTAFGNTNPTSYLRLVPHQEAPTNICWGDRNRSVLVRVPLGWTTGAAAMIHDANPQDQSPVEEPRDKQTVEFRCPDGSADIYLLLAGLVTAARHGFEMENPVAYAEERYVGVNIFEEQHKAVAERLDHLPDSCAASADALERQRAIYEVKEIFGAALIDGWIRSLRAFGDSSLREELKSDPDKIKSLVERYINVG
ncbi:MAG: glutamine synthetase family protein [Rikenellaceae bacterium]|nr:glutamine synthetase family protein [Rikenellaceae bacterium]